MAQGDIADDINDALNQIATSVPSPIFDKKGSIFKKEKRLYAKIGIGKMGAIKIIEKYYNPESKAYHFLFHHSRMVTEKALKIAKRVKHLNPDLKFIEEAAILHDIGIFLTNEPKIGCYGNKPYVCHGYLARQILEKEGLPGQALVCERHIGVGISVRDIEEKILPVPKRDMIPVSIEEQIICFADKFFSKDSDFLLKEKPLERVREYVSKFGEDKIKRFDEWVKIFGC